MVYRGLGNVKLNIPLHFIELFFQLLVLPIVPTLVVGLEVVDGDQIVCMIMIDSKEVVAIRHRDRESIDLKKVQRFVIYDRGVGFADYQVQKFAGEDIASHCLKCLDQALEKFING